VDWLKRLDRQTDAAKVFSIRVWSIDHDIGLGKREFWEGEIGVFYCVSDFVSFTEVKIEE
jgi:hypothetical protein